ncbi:MAG: MarC family protein [Verrucomicrobiota bacterium]|nr:MAG: MarC family protein [Verrucomicrobiota bacterium]
MEPCAFVASLAQDCLHSGTFTECFWQVFLAVCPLAVVALYLSMTIEYTVKERIRTACTACLVSWGFMVLTVLAGRKALETIGVEFNAFQIAGGALLLLTGFSMVRSGDPEIPGKNDNGQTKRKRADISIVPVAIPLISGPSVLTIIIANRGTCLDYSCCISCLSAVTMVAVLMYGILYLTARGAQWLTPAVLKLAFRLSGLFLIAIGVQFMMDGLKSTEWILQLVK